MRRKSFGAAILAAAVFGACGPARADATQLMRGKSLRGSIIWTTQLRRADGSMAGGPVTFSTTLYVSSTGQTFLKTRREGGGTVRNTERTPKVGGVRLNDEQHILERGWSASEDAFAILSKFPSGFMLIRYQLNGRPVTGCEISVVFRPDKPGGKIEVPMLRTRELTTLENYSTSGARCEVVDGNLFAD
jgi:hypothetical protein